MYRKMVQVYSDIIEFLKKNPDVSAIDGHLKSLLHVFDRKLPTFCIKDLIIQQNRAHLRHVIRQTLMDYAERIALLKKVTFKYQCQQELNMLSVSLNELMTWYTAHIHDKQSISFNQQSLSRDERGLTNISVSIPQEAIASYAEIFDSAQKHLNNLQSLHERASSFCKTEMPNLMTALLRLHTQSCAGAALTLDLVQEVSDLSERIALENSIDEKQFRQQNLDDELKRLEHIYSVLDNAAKQKTSTEMFNQLAEHYSFRNSDFIKANYNSNYCHPTQIERNLTHHMYQTFKAQIETKLKPLDSINTIYESVCALLQTLQNLLIDQEKIIVDLKHIEDLSLSPRDRSNNWKKREIDVLKERLLHLKLCCEHLPDNCSDLMIMLDDVTESLEEREKELALAIKTSLESFSDNCVAQLAELNAVLTESTASRIPKLNFSKQITADGSSSGSILRNLGREGGDRLREMLSPRKRA